MNQDTHFQMFGGGGNKLTEDRAWMDWLASSCWRPAVTKHCVTTLFTALARPGTLQGKHCHTVSPVTLVSWEGRGQDSTENSERKDTVQYSVASKMENFTSLGYEILVKLTWIDFFFFFCLPTTWLNL